jgi:glycosyltransferase involved in cell wall biosynthesis
MAARGHVVHVVSPEYQAVSGVDVHVVDRLPTHLRYRGQLYAALNASRLRSLIRRLRPDVVHVQYIGGTRDNIALGSLKGLIASAWGSDLVEDPGCEPTPEERRYKRWLLQRAAAVDCSSQFLVKAVRRYAGNRRDIYVIPPGVDTQVFQPGRRDEERPLTLGFMKRLMPKYGPEFLIEAMPAIVRAHPGARLLMGGEGPRRSSLEHRVEVLGMRDNVQFLGAVPYEQVAAVLRQIDIFVMPSVYDSETLGVAALEAGAVEIPVVASAVGGVGEAVLDGDTGVLVPPGDVEALTTAIVGLAAAPDRARAMGRRARRFVQEKYEWRSCVERMEGLYQHVATKGAPARTSRRVKSRAA